MRYLDPINPFPYIYKSHFDFKFDTIKHKVDEFIGYANDEIQSKKLDTLEKDGGITTVPVCRTTPPHTWEEFDEFKPWLFGQINDVWNHWNLHPMNKHLSESWINMHPHGAYTAEHHHQNVTVAVAAYLHVPENSGRFMIKNPLQIYKLGEPLDYYYYDNQKEWMPIEVKTNDVLFFPGWLTHKTEKNLSDEHRYVMSLNIMGNYV
jgi:uncharacterized protein (TIGR02466 family)